MPSCHWLHVHISTLSRHNKMHQRWEITPQSDEARPDKGGRVSFSHSSTAAFNWANWPLTHLTLPKTTRGWITLSGLFSDNPLLVSCVSAFDLMLAAENGFKTALRRHQLYTQAVILTHDDRVAKTHLSDSAWTAGVSLPCVCECYWVGQLSVYMEMILTTASTSGQKHRRTRGGWLVNIRPGLSGPDCPVCLNSHLFARVTAKESNGWRSE